MWKILERKVNLAFIVNPFYLYCVAFSLAIFVYLWGWCDIFPELSAGLILFLTLSFGLFIFANYVFTKKEYILLNWRCYNTYLNDIIFWFIIFLGLINVIYMGYLPVLDRSRNYHEFGMPVIDPLFNTLSIFFSVHFFQLYLDNKKKKILAYAIIILIIQILVFRRSTIVWIITSSFYIFLLYTKRIKLKIILAGFICIPLLSYCFGLYGNVRSSLTKSKVLNELGASDSFISSGISHNHYITYLYISSPLANLQENINRGDRFFNKADTKDFIFYCLMPVSMTIRLEKPLNLSPPECNLITPGLIVGSFFMVSFYTMGWPGMIVMLLFLFVFIVLCLFIIKIWDTFSATTFSLLSTTVSLLIFSNFLNHMDVILMLFIYPVLFHFIFTRLEVR